jgi:hypothetical protein
MATAIPTINSLTRLPLIVNEATISQTPNEPITQLRHILFFAPFSQFFPVGIKHVGKEQWGLWYRTAILIPQSLAFYFKEDGWKPF